MKKTTVETYTGSICGPRRGRYRRLQNPQWHPRQKWTRCDGDFHRGARRIPISEATVLVWHLTEEECQQVVDEEDYMSVDIPPRILCARCYRMWREHESDFTAERSVS